MWLISSLRALYNELFLLLVFASRLIHFSFLCRLSPLQPTCLQYWSKTVPRGSAQSPTWLLWTVQPPFLSLQRSGDRLSRDVGNLLAQLRIFPSSGSVQLRTTCSILFLTFSQKDLHGTFRSHAVVMYMYNVNNFILYEAWELARITIWTIMHDWKGASYSF